jgi:hypothetical protein
MLEIVKRVWQDKWEPILALVGISATFWSPIAWVWKLVWGAVGALLVVDIVGTVIREVKLAQERHVPLVVFVPSPEMPEGSVLDAYSAMIGDAASAARRAGFDERDFVARFGVTQDEWALWRDAPLTGESEIWRQMVRRFSLRVHRLARKLGEQRVFHVFLRCPAALAVGFGAVMGTHHRLAAYHHQPGERGGPYVAVTDASGREESLRVRLGRKVKAPYQCIAVREPERVTPEMYVSLFLARHDPRGCVEQAAEAAGSAVVCIEGIDARALTPQDDWLLMAQEVTDVLLGLIARPEVKRLHLAISGPVVLAFLMGVALGTHSAITVHHWFKGEQALHPVLALDRLDV